MNVNLGAANEDGTYTIPAGFRGFLPEVPASWYAEGSTPLNTDHDEDEEPTEDEAVESGAVDDENEGADAPTPSGDEGEDQP